MMQIASRNAMRTKRIEPLRSPIDGHDTSTLDDPTRGGPRTKLSTWWHLHVTVAGTSPPVVRPIIAKGGQPMALIAAGGPLGKNQPETRSSRTLTHASARTGRPRAHVAPSHRLALCLRRLPFAHLTPHPFF
ncbi:hypothetical protein GW17_00003284 [Ensete ventricosum]|nr:hypothetical protein GW17_00003284 [Ensete ventricosum]